MRYEDRLDRRPSSPLHRQRVDLRVPEPSSWLELGRLDAAARPGPGAGVREQFKCKGCKYHRVES